MINPSPTTTSSVFGLQAVKRLSRHKRKRKNPLLHLFHGPLDILPAISLLSLLNPQTKHTRALWLYGKVQRVRIRSVIAVARFLRGVPVRAVWCEMQQPDGTWSRPRLILATETDLTAQDVVEIYATRWGVEPLFHNLKRWWGVTNLWQQSKEALELWMQIRCTAYALMQMLALKLWTSFPLMEIAPWRKGALITAGLFGQWMRIQFIGLRVRSAFDRKSGHFVMPFPGQDQRLQC